MHLSCVMYMCKYTDAQLGQFSPSQRLSLATNWPTPIPTISWLESFAKPCGRPHPGFVLKHCPPSFFSWAAFLQNFSQGQLLRAWPSLSFQTPCPSQAPSLEEEQFFLVSCMWRPSSTNLA